MPGLETWTYPQISDDIASGEPCQGQSSMINAAIARMVYIVSDELFQQVNLVQHEEAGMDNDLVE